MQKTLWGGRVSRQRRKKSFKDPGSFHFLSHSTAPLCPPIPKSPFRWQRGNASERHRGWKSVLLAQGWKSLILLPVSPSSSQNSATWPHLSCKGGLGMWLVCPTGAHPLWDAARAHWARSWTRANGSKALTLFFFNLMVFVVCWATELKYSYFTCVTFKHTKSNSVICVCVCIYISFFIFFSITIYYKIWSIVPCAIQ